MNHMKVAGVPRFESISKYFSRICRWKSATVRGACSAEGVVMVGLYGRFSPLSPERHALDSPAGAPTMSIPRGGMVRADVLDDQTQKKVLRRLRIVRGQLDGLERMVSEGKYCVDVLTQVSAIHEALRGVGKVVVRNHLETCVTDKLRDRDPAQYDELMDIVYKLSK